MQIITCPDSEDGSSRDKHRVFLAGGISNCSNWQEDAVAYFKALGLSESFVLFNPRRDTFDVTNPADTEFQIKWEFDHLKACKTVFFWFPHETLCPITLYELGVCAARGQHIIVGVDPEYKRKLDVIEQLKHLRPDVHVHGSLASTLQFAASTMIELQELMKV